MPPRPSNARFSSTPYPPATVDVFHVPQPAAGDWSATATDGLAERLLGNDG